MYKKKQETNNVSETKKTDTSKLNSIRSMKLSEKMLHVRASVEYLQKSNEGFNYKYVSSSDVLTAIRDAMNMYGVILIPNIKSQNIRENTIRTKSGDRREVFTELEMEYHWINAHDPSDVYIVPWFAQGTDDFEKGIGKALTYAEKYLFLKTFNIPTDKDDPDKYQEKHAPVKSKPEPPKSQPAKNQKKLEIDIGEVGFRIVDELDQKIFLEYLIAKKWLNEDQKLTDLTNNQLELIGTHWDHMISKFNEFCKKKGE